MKQFFTSLFGAVLTTMLVVSCSSGGGSDSSDNGSNGPVAPLVSSVTPTDKAKGVSSFTKISAKFNKAMTGASIDSASFTVNSSPSTAVTGTANYNDSSATATFVPTSPAMLAPATDYTATITTGARDSAGNPLANNYTWSFKTTHLDEATFGDKGRVMTPIGGYTVTKDAAYAIAVQTNGKIVVGGDATGSLAGNTPRNAIARYNTDGALDASFNGSGVLWAQNIASGSSDHINAMTIDGATGKILVAGWSASNADASTLVARYNANGTPDTSFGTNGVVVQDLSGSFHDDSAFAIAIPTGGNIIIGGSSACGAGTCLALTRLDASNGSKDISFGASGITLTDLGATATGIRSIALDTNGKIVAAATTGANLEGTAIGHIVIVRYLNTGVLDSLFGVNGVVVTSLSSYGDAAQAIAVQPDNKILVAGWVVNDAVVLRYNTDGSLDTTFGNQGRAVTDIGNGNNYSYALALQTDGKIVTAGKATNPSDPSDTVFALMRYTKDGILDTTFEDNGIALLNFSVPGNAAHAVAIDPSGRIVVAGEAGGHFALARYVK